MEKKLIIELKNNSLSIKRFKKDLSFISMFTLMYTD